MNTNWEEQFQEYFFNADGSTFGFNPERVKDFIREQITLAENRGLERAAEVAIEREQWNAEQRTLTSNRGTAEWHETKQNEANDIAKSIRNLIIK